MLDALTLPRPQFDSLSAGIGSKLWRMTHLYRIRDKNKNLVNLTPNKIQLEMVDVTRGRRPVRDIFLKYRQGGVSTWWLLWWLDETIFKRNTISGILSHERESLGYLWEIIRVAFDNMPDPYRPRPGKYNETTLSFPDINSKIFVSLSIRSTAVHNLHISELFLVDPKDIRASLGSVSPASNVTCEGTANGVGNEGYQLYQDGKTNATQVGFRSHFYPWFIQDEYRIESKGLKIIRTPEEARLAKLAAKDYGVKVNDDQILWRRDMKKNQGSLASQEFPEDDETAFLSTGNPYFDNRKVMTLLREARDYERETPPVEETYEFTMWERPVKGDVYAAGADVAEGVDGDYSVLAIFNVTKRRMAFRYRGRVGVDVFAKACNLWGRAYFNALLAVERNNHGHAVILALRDIHSFPNLFLEDQGTRITKEREFPEPKKIVKIGWTTDKVSKPMMMDQLRVGLEEDTSTDVDNFEPEVLVLDQVFLQEALTVVQDGDYIGAVAGKHDDSVIAWAIAFQMYLFLRKRLSRHGHTGIIFGDSLQSIGLV